MNNQIPFNPISMANRRTALSVGLVTVLLLAALLPAIPLVFANASTTTLSPTAVDSKKATDLTFTVANPSASTLSYAQVQIRVSARWSVIDASAVTTSGLGGAAQVSISGSGPYVVVVSNIALAPSASGTIKLAGMVADVGTAGTTYTDQFTVFTVDASSTAGLVADTNNAAAALLATVTVASGTATQLETGMEPKATYTAPTVSPAAGLEVVVKASAGASTASTVNILIAGRDSSGVSLVGEASIPSGSTTSTAAVAVTNIAGGAATWSSIDTVYIRTTAGTTGDKYTIRVASAGATKIDDIEAKDSTSGSLTAGQSINVAAYVTDNSGKGISGVSVTFSTSAATSSEVTGGSFASSSVTTDALGAAKTVFTTSITQGTQSIKARSSGLVGSGSGTDYKITTVWGSAVSITLTASPTSIPAVGGSSTVTAKLVDSNGNTRKVSGVTVAFGTTAGTLSATSASTASDGTATVTLTPISSTTAGTSATITATASGLTGTATVSFSTGPVSSVAISVSSTSIKIQQTTTATATVKDANGNPIQGASVSFTLATVSGLATYAPSRSPSSATTGADGKATTTITASVESGTFTVTASSGGFSAVSSTITINGGDAVKLKGTAASSTIAADGSSTTTITFTLQDSYDNTVVPSAAIAITVTTSGGTFTSTGTATATESISATTGMSGAVTLKSTTTVGKVTVTGSGGGVSGTVDVTFAGSATTFKLSAKPTIVQISTPTTVTIQLIDAAGNNALNGGAAADSFTVAPSSGTVTTAPGTIAVGSSSTTLVWTAPATVPAGGVATLTVTGTLSGTGATTFTQTVQLNVQVAGAAFKLSLSASPTSAPADGSTIVTITGKLVDQSGVTIITSPGTAIQFSTTSGTFLTTTVTTSTSDGIAKAYLKAPTTAGVATITAVGGGVAGNLAVNFTSPGPTYKATSTTPTLQDTAGNPVTAPTVGNLVSVASTITNTQSSAQQTLLIVQVKDSTGKIVYLTTASLNIPASTAVTLSAGWTPTAAGTYTIEAFAWDSFSTANVLAIVQKTTVTVS